MQITTNFPNFLDKTIKKVYEDYSKIAAEKSFYSKWLRVSNTNEYDQSFTSDEGLDGLAPLEEAGAIKNLTRGVGYKTSVSSGEFSGSLLVTKKMRIRAKDDTTKLGQFLAKDMRKIVLNSQKHIELRTHAMLNNGFVTDGSADAGHGIILAPDAKALFDATHAWNSTSETFCNLLTGVFSPTKWDAALKMGTNITDAQGTPFPQNYDTILVRSNSTAALTIKRTFFGKVSSVLMDVAAATTNINLYQGTAINIIEVPWLKSDVMWYACDSKQVNPFFLHMVQKPTMEEKQIDANLSWNYPVTVSYEVACDDMPTAWLGGTGV